MTDISIIIVSFNVRYYLNACLQSVHKAIASLNCEVIVVDNNSTDRTVDYIKHKFPWVTLIANTDNAGFAKANNQAIRMAKGKYILLLNPDTIVGEDTLMQCFDFMEKNPNTGGLGVHMVDGRGCYLRESKRALPTPMVSFYKIFGLARLFPNNQKFNHYHLSSLDKEKNHKIEILSGAFMMMRTSVIQQTGLLDEAFFMYGEDIDLSYRILKAGFFNQYLADARIIHFKGESTKKGSLNYVVVFYKAMEIFAKKHFAGNHVFFFKTIIKSAIVLRAMLAVASRVFSWLASPCIKTFMRLKTQKQTMALLFLGDPSEKDHLRKALSNRKHTILDADTIRFINNKEMLDTIIQTNGITHVILSLRSLPFYQVIRTTELLSSTGVRIAMLLDNEDALIGSI